MIVEVYGVNLPPLISPIATFLIVGFFFLKSKKEINQISKQFKTGIEGGVKQMMGNFYGMMNGYGGFPLFSFLIWLVFLVDLILLGIWLWKKIEKQFMLIGLVF